MKELNFNPKKSTQEFRDNYKLHDLAEEVGLNLLVQWGFNFESFGKDRRYEKLWEKGEDKPDMIITYNGKSALLDWKGKQSKGWLVNERAVKAYENWERKLKMKVIVCFFVFNSSKILEDRRFAVVGIHPFVGSKNKQWDNNKTVEFADKLPVFNKENLISLFE